MQIESVQQLSHGHILTGPPFHPLYIPTSWQALLINPRFLSSYLDLTLGSFPTLLSLCPLLDIGPQDQIHVALRPSWGPGSMSNLLSTFELRTWLPGVKNLLTCMEYSLNHILCTLRDPVHQPCRPGVEPSSEQLDWPEGGPDWESQSDHLVWQIRSYLLGHPQNQVGQDTGRKYISAAVKNLLAHSWSPADVLFCSQNKSSPDTAISRGEHTLEWAYDACCQSRQERWWGEMEGRFKLLFLGGT